MEKDRTKVEEFLSTPRTNEEITKYSRQISRSIKKRSLELEKQGVKNHHELARSEANKIHGKFWRETLSMKMTHKKGDFKMSYH